MQVLNLDKMLSFFDNYLGLIFLFTVLLLLYYYYTSTFDFFQKKGIPFLKPVIFLGNLGPRVRATKSFHNIQLEIYDKFKGNPLAGVFESRVPILYILDPDIIKAITIKNFDNFCDRNSLNTRKPRYIRQSLLNLKGEEWKGVRSAVTPAFSSSRLKNMLPLIEQCADQMVEYLKKYVNKEIEMKQIMGHFTLEVIGVCAFGIQCDALRNENAYFYKVAEKFDYMPKYKRLFIFLILMFMPNLMQYLNITFMCSKSVKELVRMLQTAKAERKHSSSRAKDFLQILIDVAKKEESEAENVNSRKYLDDDTIDGQCLLFLIAGYETSSTLLSFAVHELAVNPQLQDKLRAHIKEVTDGKELSYELLTELTYLDGFLMEILRMYPPVARLDRVCTKPYIIPNTSVRVNVGDIVAVPAYGVHMDPKYYPEPHECRPERFMDNEKKERPSHLFLAFGAGPRNCIGLRFAMISAKTAIVGLLKSYKFSTCSQTVYPVVFDKKKPMLLKPEKGLWVRVESL